MAYVADYVYGRNAIMEALRAGDALERIYVPQGRHDPAGGRVLAAANEAHVPVVLVSRKKFEEMADEAGEDVVHQGMIALRAAVAEQSLDDMFALAAERNEKPFFVLLDEIMDPHNVGAIIRTAECAGAHGVVVLRHHAAPIAGTVAKASAGAVFHLPIVKVGNLVQTIEELKRREVWVVGAAGDGEKEYTAFDYKLPVALVVGGEGEGLRQLVKKTCDERVRIPLRGKIESLNASVAAAVILYEVVRQRAGVGS